ncbi:FMN-dependent dehydrogenase-domain-containing protein [Suillus ampliporus]|nr:FMN-dependent dehydrogenase-domain-containing protein [Suillus ampliporus]
MLTKAVRDNSANAKLLRIPPPAPPHTTFVLYLCRFQFHSPTPSTLTFLPTSDSSHNNDILGTMDDETHRTTGELIRSARAVIQEFKFEGGETPITQAESICAYDILDAILQGALEVRDSGVRYTASAIIAAHRNGKATNSSASELTKLAHDWLYLLLWPLKKAYRSTETPNSSVTSPQVVTETVSGTRSPSFLEQILERDGQRCVVSRVWQLYCGPADSPDPVQSHHVDGRKGATGLMVSMFLCSDAGLNFTNPVFMKRHGLFARHERPKFPFNQEDIRRRAAAGDEEAKQSMFLASLWLGERGSGVFRTWDDLQFIKDNWDGPISLKGIPAVNDAEKAIDMGIDGIIVSDHGGRQIDGAIASLDELDMIMRSQKVLDA